MDPGQSCFFNIDDTCRRQKTVRGPDVVTHTFWAFSYRREPRLHRDYRCAPLEVVKKVWEGSFKDGCRPTFCEQRTSADSSILENDICKDTVARACGLLCSCTDHTQPVQGDPLVRAHAIHGRVLTLDTHVDIPFEFA